MVICTSGFSLQHTLILNHRMTPFSGGRKINLHHDCISTLSDASKMKTNAGNPYMSDRRKFSFPHLLSTVSNDVSDEMMKGISSIDASNDRLEGMLTSLREENFFRLYSVDILASCEYLPQELFECYSESCEIYPIDEDEVSFRKVSFQNLFLYRFFHSNTIFYTAFCANVNVLGTINSTFPSIAFKLLNKSNNKL